MLTIPLINASTETVMHTLELRRAVSTAAGFLNDRAYRQYAAALEELANEKARN